MTETQVNTVLLADDHAVVRMGFRLLLESTGQFTVVAEAQNGEEAIQLYVKHRPDVVILDISMPGIGGLETVSHIIARYPDARILMLSAHEDTVYCRRALKAGALGYVPKRTAADELIQALRQVACGKTFLHPALAQQLAVEQITGTREPVEVLSGREFDVFLKLARGRSVAEVAETLKLSPRTVGTHLYNIKQKLGASNSAELALIAMKAGLIEPA